MSALENKNKTMRARSGQVNIDSKLVSFLYQLMRDELTPGQVERIVRDSEKDGDTLFCNGWLASYAEDLAKRLGDNPVRSDGPFEGRAMYLQGKNDAKANFPPRNNDKDYLRGWDDAKGHIHCE